MHLIKLIFTQCFCFTLFIGFSCGGNHKKGTLTSPPSKENEKGKGKGKKKEKIINVLIVNDGTEIQGKLTISSDIIKITSENSKLIFTTMKDGLVRLEKEIPEKKEEPQEPGGQVPGGQVPGGGGKKKEREEEKLNKKIQEIKQNIGQELTKIETKLKFQECKGLLNELNKKIDQKKGDVPAMEKIRKNVKEKISNVKNIQESLKKLDQELDIYENKKEDRLNKLDERVKAIEKELKDLMKKK